MKQYLTVHCKAFASLKNRIYLNRFWEIYARQSNSHRKIFPLVVTMCYSSQLRDQLLRYWCHCSDGCMPIIVIEISQAGEGGWVWEGTGWCNSCGGMPTLSIHFSWQTSLSSELFPSIRRLMKFCHMKFFKGLIWKGSPLFPALGLNVLWECGTQNQAAFSITVAY